MMKTYGLLLLIDPCSTRNLKIVITLIVSKDELGALSLHQQNFRN